MNYVGLDWAYRHSSPTLGREQLRRFCFGSSRRYRDWLARLYYLRVLDRFRPQLQPG